MLLRILLLSSWISHYNSQCCFQITDESTFALPGIVRGTVHEHLQVVCDQKIQVKYKEEDTV